MKKIVSLLVFVFVFTLTTQAQKRKKDNRPKLSIEQRTDLAVKKMTLALDLSEKQQNEIKPLLEAKAAKMKAGMKKIMEARKNKTKPTADELYAMQSKRLDDQIAFKTKMKEILNKEQFEKFEKMAKKRMERGKMMMMKKAAMKKKKMAKENKE